MLYLIYEPSVNNNIYVNIVIYLIIGLLFIITNLLVTKENKGFFWLFLHYVFLLFEVF
jgi:hypothetical protein